MKTITAAYAARAVDERLGAPHGGDADREDHHHIEEPPMLRRAGAQRPGEDHHPRQGEAERPRAGVRDVRDGYGKVRDERHAEPQDGEEL